MAHTCELFFFVKTTWRRKITFAPMKTVIWFLGRRDGAAKEAEARRLKVSVSEALVLRGMLGWLLSVEVQYVTTKGTTEAQARAMLDDPTFTFKNDALSISLHRATVSITDELEPSPFCVAVP